MTVYRSMRGEIIDIDLIKIKSKISKQDKSVGVIKRESYVKGKRKRISRKRIEEMINKTDLGNGTTETTENDDSIDDNIVEEVISSEPKQTITKADDKPIKTIKRDRK